MTEKWFRRNSTGNGYAASNLKGLAATLLFVLIFISIVMGSVLAFQRFHSPVRITVMIALGLTIALVIAFRMIVRKKSDATNQDF